MSRQSTPPPEKTASRQLELFDRFTPSAAAAEARAAETKPNPTTDGVRALLDQFFAEKVRRQDHDRDGRLSRSEFAGDDKEFTRLDEDADGLVGADDFKRQFLAANPALREMVDGFAGGLFDRLLNSPTGEPEALGGIVRSFFEDLIERHDEDDDGALRPDEFPGTREELRAILPKATDTIRSNDLIAGFQRENPDLADLRTSLLELKEAVQPAAARPRQLDLYT